jgi:hypothetical protein
MIAVTIIAVTRLATTMMKIDISTLSTNKSSFYRYLIPSTNVYYFLCLNTAKVTNSVEYLILEQTGQEQCLKS